MSADEQVTFTDDEGEEITKEELNQEIETLCDEGRDAVEEEVAVEEVVVEEVAPVRSKAPASYPHMLIRELRSFDIKNVNRTCSKCAVRQPIARIGKNELCEDCR